MSREIIINQDQFLIDFFKPDDTVTVNAQELQKVVRQLNNHRKSNIALRGRIDGLETALAVSKMEQPKVMVKLDIKA